MEKTILNIGGMNCISCANNIEKEISKLTGVNLAVINFSLENLTVEYDPSKVDLSKIEKEIISLGYYVKKNNDAVKEKPWHHFIVAVLFCAPLLFIAMAPMINLPIPKYIDPMNYPEIYSILELMLVLPIMFLGKNIYTLGYKSLYKLKPNMDSLIAVGTSSAFIYSLINTILIVVGKNELIENLYYETTGVIITLVILGRTLETISKGKTNEAIKKLLDLSPKTALILQNNEMIEVPVETVKLGDIIVVKPGQRIPVDGVIIDGITTVDESMLTGESMPVDKKVDNEVFTSSINLHGLIKFKATKIGKNTILAQIISLVENAQLTKAPIAKLADKVSGYFVPIICIVAFISGLLWLIITKDIELSLKIFISVLIIACPCALGLATPTAIMVATGKGAQKGILIKNGEALEIIHKIDTIIFDKTGTITEGKPKVTDIYCFKNISEKEVIKFAASVEIGSTHPLAIAILNKSKIDNITLSNITDFKSIDGKGISANIANDKIIVGNKKILNDYSISIINQEKIINTLTNAGKTPVYVAKNKELIGIVAIADTIKSDSPLAINKLNKMGIKTIMLTGDNNVTAKKIADSVGISEIYAEVLPQDKAKIVKRLQSENVVAMVGDGINDAPALVQANVGIAIGSGTDIAIESANIILMKNNLLDVVYVIELGQKTIKNIKENLFWAFGYNILGIPIAAGVLYALGGPLLNPMVAALTMSFSSLSVLINALRIKKFKQRGDK